MVDRVTIGEEFAVEMGIEVHAKFGQRNKT